MKYTSKFTLKERKERSKELQETYPNRKGVIVYDPITKNCKFLLLDDHTISILLIKAKERLDINKLESIILFTEDKNILCATSTILSVYNQHKNEDGYLYLELKKENTFG